MIRGYTETLRQLPKGVSLSELDKPTRLRIYKRISEKEISIFNNNNFVVNNEHSEVLIYNFETKKFRKLFNDQLQNENFKTYAQGLSHIFKDGALIVEEQDHARIILFNNKGEKEWEFVNKDVNGDIGFVNWIRVIEDELFIEKFKSLVKSKKCLN